jgi:hypothetical protein
MLLLGALKNVRLRCSRSIEFKRKDDDESRYQVLSPMNKIKLKERINNYFVEEQEILDVLYFFLNAL